MREHFLSDLVRFAKSHGFNSYAKKDTVYVEIPWYDYRDGSEGISVEKAKNLKQLKEVLGY